MCGAVRPGAQSSEQQRGGAAGSHPQAQPVGVKDSEAQPSERMDPLPQRREEGVPLRPCHRGPCPRE